MDWKPSAWAPRDGTIILVWPCGEAGPFSAYYDRHVKSWRIPDDVFESRIDLGPDWMWTEISHDPHKATI